MELGNRLRLISAIKNSKIGASSTPPSVEWCPNLLVKNLGIWDMMSGVPQKHHLKIKLPETQKENIEGNYDRRK
jgi:hypothetical protein